MDETRASIRLSSRPWPESERRPSALPTPSRRSVLPFLTGLLTCLFAGSGANADQASRDSPPTGPDFRFEHLLPEDGLSSATAYSLLQDDKGFLWIGTEGGLNFFDGYTFESFRHDPNSPGSLASDDISFMLQDAAGLLWLATWGGGLDRFDPINGTFQHFRGDPSRRDRLQDNRIQHLFEDSEGVLWIGTFSGGLSRFDAADEARTSGRFVTYRHDPEDPSSLCHDRVWRILEEPSGAFWVATGRGLCLFDRESGTFERFVHHPDDSTSLSHDVVRTLYVDSGGVLWVGTSGGLNRFNRLSKTFERFLSSSDGLTHNVINAVFEDSRARIWIGTRGGGLNVYDRTSETWWRHRHSPQDPSSLSDDDVRAFIEDRSSVLWIATRQGGLNKFDLKPPKFESFVSRTGPKNEDGPSSERIRALAEDDQGRLWLGTANGLQFHEPRSSTFEHFQRQGDPVSLPSNDLHCLLIDSVGDLWIGAGPHLLHADPDETGFSTLPLNAERGEIVDDRVMHLHEDGAGRLWIGMISGLYLLDPARRFKGHFRHVRGEPRSLSDSFVTAIFEDDHGNLWIGTHSGGLNRLDISLTSSQPTSSQQTVANVFQHFTHDPNDPNSLSNNRITAIHQQDSGNLWIGTVNGLNEMRPDGSFRRFLERDGLPHPQIAGILSDNDGRLWLATGTGLAQLDPETNSFRNYSASDGLQDGPFNVGATLKRRDGRLCFGGQKGFNCFDPLQVIDNPHPPPVVLTGFSKLGQRVGFEHAAWAVDDIQLAHGDDFFVFEFAALDYTRPQDNLYRYKLEGYDHEWTDAASRRSASYSSVPPGDYTFRVQGANSDGVWNREGLSVGLSIAPPYWQKIWFRALAVTVLVLVAGGVYSGRVRTLKRREQKLARRVEDSLADLKRSEERYRLLFERNLAGVVRATIDGRILDCNEAFARILGYTSPEECRALHVVDFVEAPDDTSSLADRLSDAGTVLSYEGSLRTREGSMVAVLWNASLVSEEDRQSPVIEGTVIDISERRRIEEGLRRAQKLESLGVLAGGIAHDFNNLLMSIMGNAEMARRDLDQTSPIQPRLQRIETASARAAELAKQMLAYSGKGDFVVRRLNLSSAVREMADLLDGALSKKAWLVYELDPELPAIEADAGQIEQIVISLVTNASEALGSAGGAITVQTGHQDYNPGELAETYLDDRLPAGRYVYLEVIDGGCGMDEDLQLRIFDPFFTTKFTGRGLGLAAVLGIVRGHRGAIKIDSKPGGGSRFRVLFPAAIDEPLLAEPTPELPPKTVREPRSHRGTVLVVDDDEFVRRVAQDMLSTLGFSVLTAGDGQEGVEVFRRRANEIELVLLDLSMPRMGGEEAFSEIRKAQPDARVILASGYDEKESTRRFAGQGLAGFIQKPYRLTHLEEKVSRVLDDAD